MPPSASAKPELGDQPGALKHSTSAVVGDKDMPANLSTNEKLPNGTKKPCGMDIPITDQIPAPIPDSPGANDTEMLLNAMNGIGTQMESMRTESKTNMDKLTTEINRLSANHIKLDSTIEELKTQQALSSLF